MSKNSCKDYGKFNVNFLLGKFVSCLCFIYRLGVLVENEFLVRGYLLVMLVGKENMVYFWVVF